jgi:hypothetical protein
MFDGEAVPHAMGPTQLTRPAPETETVSTAAEAGLQTEAHEIKEQARQAWSPEQGENLLAPDSTSRLVS